MTCRNQSECFFSAWYGYAPIKMFMTLTPQDLIPKMKFIADINDILSIPMGCSNIVQPIRML